MSLRCGSCGGLAKHTPECPCVTMGYAEPEPDHGISPAQRLDELELKSLRVSDEINAKSIAQLREKVEKLENRLIAQAVLLDDDRQKFDDLCEKVEALEKRLDACVANMFRDYDTRLDAALKRIEMMERDMARVLDHPQSVASYVPTPEEDARRQRAIEHINAINERIEAQKAAKP